MIIHCFFEQSGTFKNEFKKLGYQSYDYDIYNYFNQTDYIIDLFSEIENAYEGIPSIFDTIKNDDLILAFFPCVRFTHRMLFNFKRSKTGKKIYNDIEKFEENIRFFNEINYFYSIISKLVIVCLRKELRIIIENPYHKSHILSQFWHIQPKVIDMDRTKFGDNFKKPTQYWFINFEPKNNFVVLPICYNEYKTINSINSKRILRSIINEDYARRFILTYIL